MRNPLQFLKKLLGGGWRLLNFTRVVLANLLLLLLLVLLLAAGLNRKAPSPGPEKAALELNPAGFITEAPPPTDPWEKFFRKQIEDLRETPLQDILDAIGLAATDPAITLLVVDPGRIERISLSEALCISRALADFRNSGKKVIAVADHYDQNQYLMVCRADEIILNPIGGVDLTGLSRYRLYGRRALEKLKLDFHLFRAGEYKSALEPFIRDDMSAAARRANRELLNDLWQSASEAIFAGRPRLDRQRLSRFINDYEILLTNHQGNAAHTALANGLVDRLLSRPQWRAYLAGLAGSDPQDDSDFARIDWQEYLDGKSRSYLESPTAAKIALITARGEIVPGNQPASRIGAANLTAQLGAARRDKSVKAVVLRLDSGGGSMTASEIIRQEILKLKATGKPVIVSMGPLAASGAYWISADADEIWAEPTTLTGSIGVFGALPTFDRSLDALGLRSDGVATSPRAGALNPTRPLSPTEARIIQLGVNQGYRHFLEIVAGGRNLPSAKVATLAEGRVWSGRQAKDLGLVDHLGSLADAVRAAAARVGLSSDHAVYWRDEKSKEGFWRALLTRGRSSLLEQLFAGDRPIFTIRFGQLSAAVAGFSEGLFIGGDPAHLYAWDPLGDFTRRPRQATFSIKD